MRTLAFVAILAVLLSGTGTALAQTSVTVDPGKINVGYMNVFELDGTSWVFGQPWGHADLTAVYSGNDLTLGAAPINDPDPFWYIGGGAPGAQGNKIMEASGYAQVDGALAGLTVEFTGFVLANTLTGPHTVEAFIRDFAPDFSSFVEQAVPLGAPGVFSVSLATINDPARHVQYGFRMVGPNAWPTDVADFGTIVIGPDLAVPTEPTSMSRVKAQY
jgi:hypothetical protein